ncbi:MAG: L-threonylcarbamoyladenylate synthase [Thermovirgaceae bacterium]|nr:L-threonylcarbamoyladenylate synthase [Thermovirgaceae bacterium]
MKTEVFRVDPGNPDKYALRKAASVIRSGGLVAFPTETVYGLGANALDPKAVRKIFAAKGRPVDNPLIVHVHEPGGAAYLGVVDGRSRKLMDLFWPGPLTLVIAAAPGVPSEVTGGLETVAVRMPDHPVALVLISASGVPVAAPSANRSGRPSPTTAGAVIEDLDGRIEIVLDAGPTDVGVESTVLDVTGDVPVLLRPGGVSIESIRKAVGDVVFSPCGKEAGRSPGTRYRHYAPSIPVVLLDPEGVWKNDPRIGDARLPVAYVGISPAPVPVFAQVRFESVKQYAGGLFSALREMERSGAGVILAELPPEEGVGLAVRDRLRRAAMKPVNGNS